MQEVFEKIIDTLRAERDMDRTSVYGINQCDTLRFAFEHATQIVEQAAAEYNNGWIPCSERLPEVGEIVIVTSKNGSVFANIYYDYKYDRADKPCFHRWDDEMWQCFEPDVIAWQPLPEPYQPKGENNENS